MSRENNDDSSGKIFCKRNYKIGMPSMSWNEMSENWLLKELGDIHWNMIAEGLGVESHGLVDSNGERLYASFVRLCWKSSESLGAFTENQPLSINSELSRFGKKMFFSDATITSPKSEIAASLMSVFSSRYTEDNRELKNAAPLAQGDGRIFTYDTLPPFARQYFDVKGDLFSNGNKVKEIDVELAGQSFHLNSTPLFTTEYNIDPVDDVNGVGLIYFASFPKISDKCERLYFNKKAAPGAKDWLHQSSCLARDIYYFGNANPQEQLLYQLDACDYKGENKVQLSASIFRKEDKQLIAKIFSVKALLTTEHNKTSDNHSMTSEQIQPALLNNPLSRETLSASISEFLSSMLNAETITGSTNLKLLGIESIVFMELSSFLNDKFQLQSNPSRFYGHSTVDEIVDYLMNGEQKVIPAVTDDKQHKEQLGDIAIIGCTFRVPGADTWEALWDTLINERSAITDTPSKRWSWPSWVDLAGAHKGINRGGYLSDIDKFDASFFKISPREAELMDPQQRLLLELTWELFETAGYKASSIKGSRTGVYIGASGSDYELILQKQLESSSGTGTALSILANRISYFYDLEGPSLQIDTACSSSLVAVHEAVNAIRSGECTQAIAGGIHLMCHYAKSLSYYQAGMLSLDGECQTFDERANGYVRGEGAVVMLLKPLAKAQKDGDRIIGLIKSTAVNHGGQSGGLTVPNPSRQQELLKAAYQKAGIDVSTVSYIEAHGTGTSLGDPIEVTGLTTAFNHLQKLPKTSAWCGIGSIKTNIGHLEAAAGMAGMLKVLLSMKQQYLPATINFNVLNKKIELEGGPFYIQHTSQPWNGSSLRAGVSSFGIGGVNCHVVLESFEQKESVAKKTTSPYLFILSARNKNILTTYANNILAYLEQVTDFEPERISYTLQVAREEMEERLAVVYGTLKELKDALHNFTNGNFSKVLFAGNTKSDKQLINIFKQAPSIVQRWIDTTDLEQLGRYWCHGLTINWELLYSAEKPHKTQLPVYPFVKERYWIQTEKSGITREFVQHIHPLLHNNTSDLTEQKYTSTYTGDEQFLKDHKVGGEKILPGVAYLELARMAGSLSTHDKIFALKEVFWLSPITVDRKPQEVHIRVYPDYGEISYEVYTIKETNRQIHGKGVLSRQEVPPAEKLNIQAILQRLGQSPGKEACYDFFRQLGLDYGPTFRGIEELYFNKTEALSIISLPAEADYELMPGLMDSALQTCLGMSFGQKNISLLVPFNLRSVMIHGKLEERMYVYARRSENQSSYDIDMSTEEGQVRLSFKGVTMLPLKGPIPLKDATLSKDTTPLKLAIHNHKETVDVLTELCAITLKLKKENIEVDTEFAEYGMDSMIMMELINKLETRFNISVEPTAFINYPTIELLANYLEEEKLSAGLGASEERIIPVIPEMPLINQQTKSIRFENKKSESHKVAIIGMSCRFPYSDTIDEYWENLRAGKELISDGPGDRWDAINVYSPEPMAGKTYTTKGGFIKNPGAFDAPYFNISDHEALSMDPQQRIMLELSRELFAHAGYRKDELKSTRTGVYIGAKDNNYIRNNLHLLPEGAQQHIIVNNISNMIAARVSDFYDLKGTSHVIDTACSSSLVAIHQACEDIINGKSDMAVAGGIWILVDAFMHVGFSQAKVLSKDGRCYVFDERASGLVMGEGGGLVLLKDHAQAVADGDQIFGIIMASHVNNDGKTVGVTVPNMEGQKEVIAATLEKAGISAGEVSYYEAHGTGTLLGDPIEVKAATEIYRKSTDEKQYCAIGSVKSNLGHTMMAAGVAGLIKIVLQMQHQRIVPTLHCENPHPRFRFNESPFYPNTTLKEWSNSHKVAAISSFGFGGTNCHAILEAPLTGTTLPQRKSLPVERTSNGFYWLGQEMKNEGFRSSVFPKTMHDEPLTRDYPIVEKKVVDENVQNASVKNISEQVNEYLGKKVGNTLGVYSAKISFTNNFMEMGLESYQIIGIITPQIEKELNIELYPTIFFEYQNIEELGAYLIREHSSKLQVYFADNESASVVEQSTPVITKPLIMRTHAQNNENDLKDIAIIGMSGYLPQSPDLETFWKHLEANRDLVTEISKDRWDYRPWFDENKDAPNKSYSKWGGMLKDVDKFDPLFFGISPLHASWMDPQVRLLLQSAYHTFEDAGVVNAIKDTRTGVFVGSCFHEYWDEIVRSKTPIQNYEYSSSAMSSLSASISYYFDLQGPSIPLDNACASSMTALHLACQSIRNGECEMALIGGLNLLLSPLHYVYFSRIQALSPTGKCHTFDRKADGYVPGEGVVSILLKPLSSAIAEGNTIHGVIKGSAINHVGKSNNPTAPRPELQTRLLEDAWKAAGINPEHISYIEAHGTGTTLGDPIEVNALKSAFKKYTTKEQFCYLGSAKAHLGHLEAAAGLASVIKVLLMMKHGVIPKMPNFETLSPYIKLEDSPFKINLANETWRSDYPLLAGISSFGMTGNNAHVVLEEYKTRASSEYMSSQPAIIVLSAREEDRLKEQVQNINRHIRITPHINIHDLAYTLQTNREPMEERLAVVVKDVNELKDALSTYLQGKTGNFFRGSIQNNSASEVSITATGDYASIASQWAMGANVKWSLLYPSGTPAKISLPVYPFAKERYWMTQRLEQEIKNTDKLHPLLHFAQ